MLRQIWAGVRRVVFPQSFTGTLFCAGILVVSAAVRAERPITTLVCVGFLSLIAFYFRRAAVATLDADPTSWALDLFGGPYRWTVKRYIDRQPESSGVLRTLLRQIPVVETHAQPDTAHTHPKSASDRSSVHTAIDLFATTAGLTPYWYQMSLSDQRRGRHGFRSYLWAKSIPSNNSVMSAPLDALVIVADGDFYVDMPLLLSRTYPRPVLLYTINPEAVAYTSEEITFHFDPDNNLVWRVRGGGNYRHELWDYNHDTLYTVSADWRVHYYLVERRKVAPHRELVLLVPLGAVYLLDCWLFPLPKASPLERMRVVSGRYARLHVFTDHGAVVSTGIAGICAETTVPDAVDAAIAVTARIAKLELTNHSVSTWLADHDDPVLAATRLVEYHRDHAGRAGGTHVYPASMAVRGYEFYQPHHDHRDQMVAFCSPIIHGAFVPRVTLMNDAWCVQSRVLDIANDTDLAPRDLMFMREFVEFVIVRPHSLAPFTADEVWARQARPSQRRLLLEAERTNTQRRRGKIFQKGESYPDVKDPRGITIIDSTIDKRDYSMFTYALAAVFETFPWYAFGKDGPAIARRVVEVCKGATTHVHLTDFSRMDGRVSRSMRTLERAVFLRAFHPSHHVRLDDLLKSQHHLRCVTTHGVKYDSAWARLSGSPETAICNTLDNAFTAYVAFRDSGRTPKEAWDALGIYGGDDGLTADACARTYERAANRLGQVLEVDEILKGEPGVDFLARWYGPGVWWGDSNSCTDIPRALRKFHVTTRLPTNVTNEQKFLEKAYSLSLTDNRTPIVSLIVRKAEHYDPKFRENVRGLLLSYAATLPAQYPNVRADWMLDRALGAMPGLNVDAFELWASHGDALLSPPLILEPHQPLPHSKYDVLVEDEVVPKKGTTVQSAYKRGRKARPANPQNAVSLVNAHSPRPSPSPSEIAASAAAMPVADDAQA